VLRPDRGCWGAIMEMGTRSNLRHILEGHIFEFRRYPHPGRGLQVLLCLINNHYVNFSGVLRSRFEAISTDFDGRSLRLAVGCWGPGLVSCSPGASAFHSRSMTVASGRSRSRVATGPRERESGRRKREKDRPGLLPPLPYVFAM